MAQIRPFLSSRPAAVRAREVASVPYDVVDTREARDLAKGNPTSFLHVCRPEIDLPEGVSLYSDPVYEKGRENLDRFEANGTLLPDPVPRLLVYRQTWRGAWQDGLVAGCAVDDYDSDVIKKHEKTRKDKEDDRTKHLLAQAAHAEPVFLTYRATDAIDARVAKVTSAPPEIDFESEDGVRHALWIVPGEDEAFFVQAFAAIPVLYVADGHHRSASASRARAALKAKGPVGPDHPVQWFPAAIFPDRELRILPYNRLVKDLRGRTPEAFLAEVGKAFRVSEASGSKNANPAEPVGKGEVRMFLDGRWYALEPKAPVPENDPIRSLDVSILQERLLGAILGIQDPRTDKRIDFVGGIRGTSELEKRVRSGAFAVAFSMHPTTVAELMAIADAGETMPPKSTWFEPKLRSGLFVHRF